MKFYGEPKLTVMRSVRNRMTGVVNRQKVCEFDENGQLETHDPIIANILVNHFNGCTWDKDELEKEFAEYHHAKVEEVKPEEVKPGRVCKKCGESFESQSELLKHARKVHPKIKEA